MTKFIVNATPLSGLKVLQRIPSEDSRGLFARLWCAKEFESLGWIEPVAQINMSVTNKRGTVRGLHFQNPPMAEMKFVSCLQGEVFDVAVDLRKDSPTFLKWHAELLSPHNNRSLLIPKGFAHGFQTLSHEAELVYIHSAAYSQTHEVGILAQDPLIAIDWPLEITERSERDLKHLPLIKDWKGLVI